MPNVFNTSFSSIWSANNPVFIRPGGLESAYYYDTFEIILYKSGNFEIGTNSSVDTFGSIYNGTFIADFPERNLLASDDDSGENKQFRLVVYLESNVRYTLVTTTHHGSSFGLYKVIVSGPIRVNLIKTTLVSTTTRPPTTGSGPITTQRRKKIFHDRTV